MDLDVSLDYGVTLLAALLIGTGFVLQQNAAQRANLALVNAGPSAITLRVQT